MTTLRNRLALVLLPLAFSTAAVLSAPVTAQTNKLIIESGDNASSRQRAEMDKEQWSNTRTLRQKVNRRTEKEWDKTDAAYDLRDNCLKSANVNVYWEANTERCLDRRTGRPILAP